MKKPHTDNEVSMTFTGPIAMMEQALEVMHSLGFESEEQLLSHQGVEGSIPWRETNYFKEIEDKLPSVFLSGARHREGLTVPRRLALTNRYPDIVRS